MFITCISCFLYTSFWGLAALTYDVLAFMLQSMIGLFVQKHPHVYAGMLGGIHFIYW